MKHYENLEQAMCRELEMLDKKYGSDAKEMSPQDIEHADVLYHALKSAATYHAMKDAEDWDEEEESGARGRSYARRRDSMGRYSGGRYMSGYSGRYDDGYSGHYPPMMPYGRDDWRY